MAGTNTSQPLLKAHLLVHRAELKGRLASLLDDDGVLTNGGAGEFETLYNRLSILHLFNN